MVSNEVAAEIFRLKTKRHLGMGDIARRFGITEDEAWNAYTQYDPDTFVAEKIGDAYVLSQKAFLTGGATDNLPTIPKYVFKDEPEPFHLYAADALVMADFHCPHYNVELFKRAIAVTKTYFPMIDRVIVAGDLFNFDKASKFPKSGPDETLKEGFAAAREVLVTLDREFNEVIITNGNHDERISRKLDMDLHLKYLVAAALGDFVPRSIMRVTNLDYVYLGENWIVGHPSTYSILGGKTPADIADIEQRNVATGHNHIVGVQQSKSGKYLGVDFGHMTSAPDHFYAQRRLTKFPRWNAGFLVVSNGYAYPFYENHTDWERWL